MPNKFPPLSVPPSSLYTGQEGDDLHSVEVARTRMETLVIGRTPLPAS